jgi:hypothetical protein
MGFLDKLFGRKKQEPDQVKTPSADTGMQEPTPSTEQGGGGMPSPGGESPSGGETTGSGQSS